MGLGRRRRHHKNTPPATTKAPRRLTRRYSIQDIIILGCLPLRFFYTVRDRFNTHESLGLTSPGRTAEARQQQDGSVRLPEALFPYVNKKSLHPAK